MISAGWIPRVLDLDEIADALNDFPPAAIQALACITGTFGPPVAWPE